MKVSVSGIQNGMYLVDESVHSALMTRCNVDGSKVHLRF